MIEIVIPFAEINNARAHAIKEFLIKLIEVKLQSTVNGAVGSNAPLRHRVGHRLDTDAGTQLRPISKSQIQRLRAREAEVPGPVKKHLIAISDRLSKSIVLKVYKDLMSSQINGSA